MKVGKPCSFYHEGGHGDRHWVVGWRYGVVRAIPIKGAKKGWVQVEIPVRQYTVENDRYKLKPFIRVWVHASAINEPGDFKYHGLSVIETLKERKEEKARQQKKADKKKRTKSR